MRKEMTEMQNLVDSLKVANEQLQTANDTLRTKHTVTFTVFILVILFLISVLFWGVV